MVLKNSYNGGNLFSQVKDNKADDGRHNAALIWFGVIVLMIIGVSVATFIL